MAETREFKVGIAIAETTPKARQLLRHERKCYLSLVPGEKQYTREFLIRELGLAFADALVTLAVDEEIG